MTLIVPCYNEADRLDRDRFVALSRQVSLVFVDDGSSDDTPAMLEALSAEPGISHLRLGRNRGKAEAVRQGLIDAITHGAEAVGFTDADLATPPDELERLVRLHQERGVKVVMGARVARAGAQIERDGRRHYIGRVFATLASLLLQHRFYDTQCGAKVFTVTPELEEALAEPFLSRWIFDVELIGRLLQAGYAYDDFLEVPLHTWVDPGGSKVGPFDVINSVRDLARLKQDFDRRRG